MILYGVNEGGDLIVDGRKQGPWLREAPYLVYVLGSMPQNVVKLLEAGDTAYGRPGIVFGVSIEGENGTTRIMSADVWGLRKGAESIDVAKILKDIKSVCDEEGFKWKRTAGATSMSLLDEFCELRPLAPRFRQMAHSGLHCGPMIHCRGGAKWGAHIDIKAAYLHALYQPMPVGGWIVSSRTGRRTETMLKSDGFVNCTVEIAETEHTREIGPLPVQLSSGKMVYPLGIVRGVWPTTILRPAIERGEVDVLALHYMARPRGFKPLFDEFADYVRTLPKQVGKPLYSRLWGKMASQGYWEGSTSMHPGGSVPANGRLYWHYEDRPFWKAQAPRYYCPDLAAWIVSINFARMMDAIRSLKPGSIIAAHIDSIFTDDIEGAQRLCVENAEPGEFEMEGEGEIRYYAQGRYYVHGLDYLHFGYNGMEDRPTTPEAFDAICQSMVRNNPRRRMWYTDPNEDINARSESAYIDSIALVDDPVYGYCPTDRDIWNSRGYMHDDVQKKVDALYAEANAPDYEMPAEVRAAKFAELKEKWARDHE